ncbi:hypothetical protein MJM28_30095, partial [Salmonella enterica subsp. enterica serovar Montevideo]|nr:hypothetical protein [Salmonella enterica subsp. enterica serovar Montevideo]
VESLEVLPQTKVWSRAMYFRLFAFDYLSKKVNTLLYLDADVVSERPFKPQEQDYLLYKFNRFQACRYGLEGVLTDAYTGDRRRLA